MERSAERQRSMLEMEWLTHDMARSNSWKQYRNIQRDYVACNKQFVVWDSHDSQPRIIDILRVGAVGVSWDEGITYVLNSEKNDQQYTVTARPREIMMGLFVWIPAFSDVRFAPFHYTSPGSARRLTLPIMFRTAHSPRRLVEAARYVSSMNDFVAAWPGIF